jgi:hypothetical protein
MNNNDPNPLFPDFVCAQMMMPFVFTEDDFMSRADTPENESTFALITPKYCTPDILERRKGFGHLVNGGVFNGNLFFKINSNYSYFSFLFLQVTNKVPLLYS